MPYNNVQMSFVGNVILTGYEPRGKEFESLRARQIKRVGLSKPTRFLFWIPDISRYASKQFYVELFASRKKQSHR